MVFALIRTVCRDAVEVTHINLNDGSLEGMRHKKYPAFSVQYHPEHAPGPHDAEYLFDRFMDLMASRAETINLKCEPKPKSLLFQDA